MENENSIPDKLEGDEESVEKKEEFLENSF